MSSFIHSSSLQNPGNRTSGNGKLGCLLSNMSGERSFIYSLINLNIWRSFGSVLVLSGKGDYG